MNNPAERGLGRLRRQGTTAMLKIQTLLFARNSMTLSEQHRAEVIASRVRLVAWMFAVLTPSWILVDAFTYSWPLWGYLAALRLVTAGFFALIVVWSDETRDIRKARFMLWALMLIPMAFFMISNPIMAQFEMHGIAQAVSMGYIFLPFVMMAGLSIFPITAAEGLGYALPVMIVTAALPLVVDNLILVPFNSYFGALWLLGLIGVVATFAGMSQLHFMAQLVKQSSHDPLTQVYNRRAGIDLLASHFDLAKRGQFSLALAFIDLDHFKQINDNYGHEEGDNALREAAERIRCTLRGTDLVVRWGGEEFVVIMPNTSHENAIIPMTRLLERGLGARPDEKQLTASIGVAERLADECDDYRKLIDIADQRMYMAKSQGRCRIVAEGNREVTVDAQAFHQPEPLAEVL